MSVIALMAQDTPRICAIMEGLQTASMPTAIISLNPLDW